MTDDEFIKELHARVHRHGNKISAIEGQMLADRMVGDERYRQVESNTTGIRAELSSLSMLVTQQSSAMNEVSQGQKSILQTMVSDRETVIATAKALADAEMSRRDRDTQHRNHVTQQRDHVAQQWVTPNRVITTALGVLALAAYFSQRV